jgi:hypothetical protein
VSWRDNARDQAAAFARAQGAKAGAAARRQGMAAYKRLVEAAPAAAVDAVDNRAVAFLAGRAHVKDLRAASDWGTSLKVPSKWYATDGSGRFYYFKKKKTNILPGWNCFGRLAVTAYGTNAAAAYILHEGQLTDRRPAGWVSAATLAGAAYGGLDGGPRDWGWRDNEDLDLDIAMVEKLRAADPGPFIREPLGNYAEYLFQSMVSA